MGRVGRLVYLAPALGLYGLFVLWPLLRSVWLALQRWNGYGPETFIGLRNVADLWADPVFRTSLEHSLLWEVAAALLVSALGLGLALLARASRLQSVALVTLFFPVLLPAAVIAAIWTLVYSPLHGLLNTVLQKIGLAPLAADWLGDPHLALPALFVAWSWSALGIGALLFWAGLRSIGREYIDVARVEGAGPLGRFRHVLLPGLRRTIAIVVLINAALAGQVFDLIFVTTGGGPGYATMLLPIDMYGRAFGGQTGQGAAVAVVQIVLGLIPAGFAVLLLRGTPESMHDGDGRESVLPRPAAAWAASVAVVGLLAVLLLPILWLLAVALGWGDLTVGTSAPTLDPSTWGWSSFSAAWDAGMGGALETSFLLALGAAALTVAFAPFAAFALFRAPRVWQIPLAVVLAIGLFQPSPVIIIPLFSLLKDLGLLDTPWGVLLPEVARNVPFAVLLLWASFVQLPTDVLRAADVDGAAPFQQLTRVALPLVRPAMVAIIVWSFAASWNEYLLPTLVSQDGSLQTVPTLLGSFIGNYDTQYGLLAAGSLLALLPCLAVYLGLRGPAAAGLLRLERRIG
jgi:raffinose/stachyose/melibiose transport system permease protein